MGIGILPTNDPNATDKQAKHPPHITAPTQPLQHSFSRHIRVSLNLSQKGRGFPGLGRNPMQGGSSQWILGSFQHEFQLLNRHNNSPRKQHHKQPTAQAEMFRGGSALTTTPLPTYAYRFTPPLTPIGSRVRNLPVAGSRYRCVSKSIPLSTSV